MPDLQTSVGWFFRDAEGRVAVWQTPNLPLVGWAVAAALAFVLPAGRWRVGAEYVGFGFLFTWAFLELTRGASPFRRLLGAVVLAGSLYSKVR